MAGAPFREVFRQHPPLAAALQKVQNAAENIIQINCAWLRLLACRLEQGSDSGKLNPTDVTWVRMTHCYLQLPVESIQHTSSQRS